MQALLAAIDGTAGAQVSRALQARHHDARAVDDLAGAEAAIRAGEVDLVVASGPESCRRLRAAPGGDAVVILAIVDADAALADAFAAGADDAIARPLADGPLVARILAAERLIGEVQCRRFVEAAQEAIFVTDAVGHIVSWNRRAREVFGYAPEEILGKSVTLLMPPRYDRAHLGSFRGAGAPGPAGIRTLEVHGLRKGGDEFPMELTLAGWGAGKRRRHGAIVRDITARKQAEGAIYRIQSEFRNVIDTLPVGIAVVRDGRLAFANGALAGSLGYGVTELLDHDFVALVHPDDRDLVNARLRALEETRTAPAPVDLRFVRRDRSVIVLELAPVQVIEFAGVKTELVVARDVTVQKHAEQALRESEERHRAIISIPDCLWTGKYDGGRWREFYCTPVIERVTGYRAEQLFGEGPGAGPGNLWFKMVHPSDRGAYRSALERLVKGEEVQLEHRIVRADGVVRWVRSRIIATPLAGEAGAFQFSGVVSDISERKEAEEDQRRLQDAIEKSALEWRLTFDTVDAAIVILDPDARIRRLNRTAQELAGKDYQELARQPVGGVAPGRLWHKLAEAAAATRASRQVTWCQVADEPSGRSWDVSATLMSGPGLADERIIVVAREITRLVQLQESLRRSETMSAMGALVAGVAHEVRNPLFGMSACLDAFDARFGERAEHRQYVSVLRGELNRLSELMRDLLEYGKPPSPVLIDGSLEDIIVRAVVCCEPLAQKGQVGLGRGIAAALPRLKMDELRLLRVFQNLLENAIQHTPVAGRVLVEAHRVVRVGAAWIECLVKDTGPGFRAEDVRRVFEPFFTRRAGGTGLGLSIVQRIVEEHGGVVSVGNRSEGGAVITLLFPAAEA